MVKAPKKNQNKSDKKKEKANLLLESRTDALETLYKFKQNAAEEMHRLEKAKIEREETYAKEMFFLQKMKVCKEIELVEEGLEVKKFKKAAAEELLALRKEFLNMEKRRVMFLSSSSSSLASSVSYTQYSWASAPDTQ